MLLNCFGKLTFKSSTECKPFVEAVPKSNIEHQNCNLLLHLFVIFQNHHNNHNECDNVCDDADHGRNCIKLHCSGSNLILKIDKLVFKTLSNTIYNLLLHGSDIKRLHQTFTINILLHIYNKFIDIWHAVVNE